VYAVSLKTKNGEAVCGICSFTSVFQSFVLEFLATAIVA